MVTRNLALRCPVSLSLASLVVVFAGAMIARSEPETADLRPKDGKEALAWLLEGNKRFMEDRPRHDHESLRRRSMLDDGQHPFAVVLGCADSRVPPELILDHGLGDLFVIRVAGNVVADDEAGSIEYAVEHLGTPLILVLGHEKCGAVTAALGDHGSEPKELARLLRRVEPAVADIDPSLPMETRIHLGVEANVRQSVEQLRAIAKREVGTRSALIVGAVYELDTGRVRVLP